MWSTHYMNLLSINSASHAIFVLRTIKPFLTSKSEVRNSFVKMAEPFLGRLV